MKTENTKKYPMIEDLYVSKKTGAMFLLRTDENGRDFIDIENSVHRDLKRFKKVGHNNHFIIYETKKAFAASSH